MPDGKHKILIYSSTKNLAVVREFVEKMAQRSGFDTRAVNEIVMSADEACTNVIRYAHKYDESQSIEISVSNISGQFIINISYKGMEFDPNGVEVPDMKKYFSEHRIGGLGIPLIKKFMNKIEYSHTNPDNNSLKLIKAIESA